MENFKGGGMLITERGLIDVAAGVAQKRLPRRVIYWCKVCNFTHFPRQIRAQLGRDFFTRQ